MWRILLAVLVFLAAPAWGGGVQVGQPIQKGRLTIFPIGGPAVAAGEKYLTLDEGLEAGTVKVGELGSLVSQSRILRGPTLPPQDVSRVNELALVNNSDRPLLLLAGEIVSGGKQDRVVARDRIVPPHSAPVPLGVFCVEPGRWRGLSMEFAAAKLMAAPEIRKQALVAQDQGKVWEEVARSRTAMAETVTVTGVVDSVQTSSSYAGAAKASVVEHRVTEDANAFLPELPDNALGMVVAVDGRLVWADLFPNVALFRRYRAKLLQSYVVESYRVTGAASQPPSLAEAQKFLREAGGRQNIEVEPGLYRLVRSEAEGMVTYELEALGEGGVLRLHFARMVK